MARLARKSKAVDPAFEDQLVLAHWLLSRLGLADMDAAKAKIEAFEGEPWVGSPTPYLEGLLSGWLPEMGPRGGEFEAQLREADLRIVQVTQAMNARRADLIAWKYFQYLALLCADLYFDVLLSQRDWLRGALNTTLGDFCSDWAKPLNRFEVDDAGDDPLDRLAFWMATGSGKTLLMHAHLRLYREARERHHLPQHAYTVLLTPNRGLSEQHEREFIASDIPAQVFRKGSTREQHGGVEILEFTRFSDKPGPETINVDYFDSPKGCLVLVDEGHRGTSSEDGVWLQTRRELSRGGMMLEYSATLKHAASSEPMRQVYARSIAIDYSYRRFHGDGYGKHWRILNLPNQEADALDTYLSGALLTLVQQTWVFAQEPELVASHGLEKPLAIFVGNTVIGKSSKDAETKAEAAQFSDIHRLLAFLGAFASERQRPHFERVLQRLLEGRSGLARASDGNDVFAQLFRELTADTATHRPWDGPRAYQEILHRLFGTDTPGVLEVQERKDGTGEIALRIGSGEPFGLVSVGDTSGLRKLLDGDTSGNFVVHGNSFGEPLFQRLGERNSPIQFLIGSRKFTEGWNSYRVSLIGLLNLGRTPGTQVIQLFGRGVRLKGERDSLKRASEPKSKATTRLGKLNVLETLSIYGIRADYMEQFRAELEKEGIAEDGDQRESTGQTVPIKRLQERVPHLRILKTPTDGDYQKDGANLDLGWDEKVAPIIVHAWPRINFRASGGDDTTASVELARYSLPLVCAALLDHEALYADLWKLKTERRWMRLCLPRYVENRPLTEWLLAHANGHWLQLEIPPDLLQPASMQRNLTLWQRVASQGLRQYVTQWMQLRLRQWKTLNAEPAWLDELSPDELDRNFPEAYRTRTSGDDVELTEAVVAMIEAIITEVGSGKVRDRRGVSDNLGVFKGKRHLWWPLLYVGKKKPEVSILSTPVLLSRSEFDFVERIEAWLDKTQPILDGAEVHLLRNEARTGMGLFDKKGFYPDFLLWIRKGDSQTLVLVDPKGLRNLQTNAELFKVNLHVTLTQIEKRLADPNLKLEAWLISDAPELGAPEHLRPFADKHIAHLGDDISVGEWFRALLRLQ